MSLEIKNLHANIQDKAILNGLNLTLPKGEVHAIMGPNGAGKSTLSKILCGHEDYTVTAGEVLMDGVNLLDLPVDVRSREGLFLAFQYPLEIAGVTNANFLRAALQARLPSYMVPSLLKPYDGEFPRTPNGKYDRKQVLALTFA